MSCDADITVFKVDCSYRVNITLINDPHSFYVRSIHADVILPEIEKPGSPKTAEDIQPGLRIVYDSRVLKKYVRGQICYFNMDEKSCDIMAMDYGHFEKDIPLDSVFSPAATDPRQLYPPLAVHCQLHYCAPKGGKFSEEVIAAMKRFVGEGSGTITVKSQLSSKLIVELQSSKFHDVSDMLNLMGHTCLTSFNGPVQRAYNYLVPNLRLPALTETLKYKHRIVKVGDTFMVRVQSAKSLSEFYVADIMEWKKMRSSEVYFNEYCKNLPELDIEGVTPGYHCAVRIGCPAKYERAIIKEKSSENRFLAQFVDTGKEMEVHYTWVKHVDKEQYYAEPILAIYCAAVESQKSWLMSQPSFLLPGCEIMIELVEVGHEFDEPHKVNVFLLKDG